MIAVAATSAARPGEDGLGPDDLRRIEERIEQEIRKLRRTAARPLSEFQRGGDDVDVTNLRQAHEVEQSLRARCAEALAEWTEALRQLREDPASFGICQGCGGRIPLSRLELLPSTRRCVGC